MYGISMVCARQIIAWISIFWFKKCIKNLGCDEDVIITLPRVGFKVSESITVEDVLIKEGVAPVLMDESLPEKKEKKVVMFSIWVF